MITVFLRPLMQGRINQMGLAQEPLKDCTFPRGAVDVKARRINGPTRVLPLLFPTYCHCRAMLARWFYISSSLLSGDEAEDLVRDIVKISISRNQSLGVTGALLFTGHSFTQYLEGEAAAIEELKASILRDRRHENVRTIASGDYTHRRFVTWSLAYAGPSQFVASIVERALADALQSGEAAIEQLAQLLSEFSIGGRS